MLRALLAILLCIGGLVLADAAPARAEPLVVATTPDLKSIADAVSGGAARVVSLVPPGHDPEAFEPRPGDLAVLRSAALVVRVGLGYDDWLDRLLGQVQTPGLRPGGDRVIDLSQAIALLEVQGRSVEAPSGHAHGRANPHYWLDPANGAFMSAVIAEALVRLAPDQRDTIASAQARFTAELDRRMERWEWALQPYRGAAVVAYHNSWPYFARRFRLRVVDVIEPKEGVPPSPARLAALAAAMREANVRVILQEPYEPADAARFLASRTGARVLVLAPGVGAIEDTGDYLSLFDRNVALLSEALAGSR